MSFKGSPKVPPITTKAWVVSSLPPYALFSTNFYILFSGTPALNWELASYTEEAVTAGM